MPQLERRVDGFERGHRSPALAGGEAMKRIAIALILLAGANAIGTTGSCPRAPQPGDPLRGLTAEELARFQKGREVFARTFTPETGLGPLFNADGCAECHEDPAPGGTGDEVEVHVAVVRPDGLCDPLADEGGFVIQQHTTPALKAALGIDSEPIPPDATSRAARTTPELFGFGLLDAVPESTILALAEKQSQDRDGISGRPNHFIDGRIGRFGRKAFVPTLAEFNHGAFVIEIGITNPAQPTEETIGGKPIPPGVDPAADPEIGDADMNAVDDFLRFLAPPAPLPLDGEGTRGQLIFGTIGCASCHVPSLRTGPSPVRALNLQTVHAYTDLLLHDMGGERADICLGDASPSEFRTEPLMGLRLKSTFLHDGKAATIEEAIRLHAGEATESRKRFEQLSDVSRAALLRFLASL
jgi:CxxC motif-containing protein (DUF1111 family)